MESTKQTLKEAVTWGIFLGILTTLLVLFNLMFHEQAHTDIMNHNGCTNITTKYTSLLDGYTKCSNYENRTMSYESEYNLHSQIEIVDYFIEMLIVFIMAIIFIIIILQKR